MTRIDEMLNHISPLDINPASSPDADSAAVALGARPAVKSVLSGLAWYAAVVWLSFASDIEIDHVSALLEGLFIMLLTASIVAISPSLRGGRTAHCEQNWNARGKRVQAFPAD